MTCPEVQNSLSLYLYGELDFALEDQVEDHLADCAFCQQALKREKMWHSSLNAEETSLPLDWVAACRADLASQMLNTAKIPNEVPLSLWSRCRRWWDSVSLVSSAWPARVSAALLLMTLGFGAGKWTGRAVYSESYGPAERPALQAPYMRVRNVQTDGSGQVRLALQRIQEGELVGPATNSVVRQFLLSALKDPVDPAVRVGSVESLSGQSGNDVRDALLTSVLQDRNAAVRLKALEALRPFAADPATRDILIQVLQQDANPEVRMAAIDVLLPVSTAKVSLPPDLITVFEQMIAAQREDSYVRMRCLQAVQNAKQAEATKQQSSAQGQIY